MSSLYFKFRPVESGSEFIIARPKHLCLLVLQRNYFFLRIPEDDEEEELEEEERDIEGDKKESGSRRNR